MPLWLLSFSFSVQPDSQKSFKIFGDSLFVEKPRKILGIVVLYLTNLDNTIVTGLCRTLRCGQEPVIELLCFRKIRLQSWRQEPQPQALAIDALNSCSFREACG